MEGTKNVFFHKILPFLGLPKNDFIRQVTNQGRLLGQWIQKVTLVDKVSEIMKLKLTRFNVSNNFGRMVFKVITASVCNH